MHISDNEAHFTLTFTVASDFYINNKDKERSEKRSKSVESKDLVHSVKRIQKEERKMVPYELEEKGMEKQVTSKFCFKDTTGNISSIESLPEMKNRFILINLSEKSINDCRMWN